MQHYSKSAKSNADSKSSINLIQIRQAYFDSASKFHSQDSLTIHLMYSLSIDPYQICSIRNEDIIDKDLICFWDYKISSTKLWFMYCELWSDIMFIKNITRLQKGKTRAT